MDFIRKSSLKGDIEAFISHCAEFIGTNQASCMGVSKFRVLTHITDDLCNTGGIGYSSGNLYEMYHKAFKDAYKNTFKQLPLERHLGKWQGNKISSLQEKAVNFRTANLLQISSIVTMKARQDRKSTSLL